MKRFRIALAVLTLACGLTAPSQASAAVIILRTGVDAALNPLGENVTDPFWDIQISDNIPRDAESVNSEVRCCGMDTADPAARWISDASVTKGSSATGWGIGTTVHTYRDFDLTGFNIAATTLTGVWRVADNQLGVFINGHLIPGTNTGVFGFGTDLPLSAAGAAFFVPGLNTIELRGSSVNSTFDAFYLNAVVEGRTASTPEPATLALFGVGLIGLRAARRRRAK